MHQLLSAYNRRGVAAVETPGKGGRRNQYLTLEQERAFLQPYLARAAQGDVATAAEIQQALEAKVKQPVAPSTLYRLLARHGWMLIGAPSRPARTPQHTPAHEPTVPVRKRGERRATRENRPPSPYSYPSDLTDQEWAILEPLIPPPKPGGRPCRWERREIVNAILYVLRSGGIWRLLPPDFPPWQTVYHSFRLWRLDGTWERVHTHVREQARRQAGREATPSAVILDSQSVKTTEKGGHVAMTPARR